MTVHTKEKKHICELCNKGFAQASSLNTHVRKMHQEEEKPFSCEVCAKKFSMKKNLVRHLKVHFDKYSREKRNVSDEVSQMLVEEYVEAELNNEFDQSSESEESSKEQSSSDYSDYEELIDRIQSR